MSEASADPTISALREQITAADRELLSAFARRVAVARKIRERKGEQGYPLIDPERERQLLEIWRESANGNLSQATIDDLFATVLALSKRELER
jgi:chorismate mutase / prephenate dehydratase